MSTTVEMGRQGLECHATDATADEVIDIFNDICERHGVDQDSIVNNLPEGEGIECYVCNHITQEEITTISRRLFSLYGPEGLSYDNAGIFMLFISWGYNLDRAILVKMKAEFESFKNKMENGLPPWDGFGGNPADYYSRYYSKERWMPVLDAEIDQIAGMM